MTPRSITLTLALLAPALALAQTAASGVATTPTSVISDVDTYVKIIGAVLTGIATLIGLPIVFLTYRKTRAEITKLELEANALRDKQTTQADRSKDEEGNIRILVDRSPNTNIQVLADPRFLAPLLILLDFIFASVVLTLAGHILSIFSFGVVRTLALAVLSVALLLPIARQVLRVRTVLRPPRTSEEVRDSQKQARITFYTIYAIFMLSSLLLGILILTTASTNLTDAGRYLSWGLIGWGMLLIMAYPISNRRFERYLAGIYTLDTQ
jgi:hypothetical protein